MGIEEKYKERPFFATWWFEGLMVVLCLVTGWFLWQVIDLHWHQNALVSNRFVELARSLTEGHGYTLTEGGRRLPYLDTPPLYPGVLSLLMLAAGTTRLAELWEPLIFLNLSLYLLSVLLVYHFVGQRIRKPYGYLITFLYTLSPLTLSAVESLTPELAYLVLSLAAMITIDQYFAEKKSDDIRRWQVIWVCFWVVLALMTKTLGFCLLAAFFLKTLGRLGTKRAFVVLGTVLLLMLPWFLRDVIHRNFSNIVPYSLEQVMPATLTLDNPLKKPKDFARQVWRNTDSTLAEMTRVTLGTVSFNDFVAVPEDWAFRFTEVPWIRWALGLFILVGAVFGLYRFSGIGSLYLFIGLATTLVLPLQHHLSLFPVFPLLLFCLFNGVMWLGRGCRQFRLPLANVAVPALTVLIAFNSLNEHLGSARASKHVPKPQPLVAGEVLPESGPGNGRQKALSWLQINTPTRARVVSGGRFSTSPAADYVMEDGQNPADALFSSLLETRPEQFRLVYNDTPSRIRIWQVLPQSPP